MDYGDAESIASAMKCVVVVGAGIIGLLCSYELRRRGAAVTLVDKGQVGSGCSWANNGWVVPSFSMPLPSPGLRRAVLIWMASSSRPLYIRARLDLGLARWLLAFWLHCNNRDYEVGVRALAEANRGTMELFDELRSSGVDFEINRSRVLFLFRTRAAQDAIMEDLERLAAHGYPSPQRLSRQEVREQQPDARPEVVGVVLAPEERTVRPETLVAGLTARLRVLGVEIREEVEAVGIWSRRGSATMIHTTQGDLEAEQLLLATGAWSGVLGRKLGIRLPVQAGKGYNITITDPATLLSRPLYLDEARVAITPPLQGLYGLMEPWNSLGSPQMRWRRYMQ